MTDNQTSIEDIYIGTKEVSENLKFDISKLQQWIDAVSYTHLTLPTKA